MDAPHTFQVNDFLTFTVAILVFLTGFVATRHVAFLRNYNIPEPVTGGLLAAVVTLGVFVFSGASINFDLGIRDILLVYFFTTIGLNARFADLMKGGRKLVILLILTVLFIGFQDVIGVLGAAMFGLRDVVGVLVGSASLIGGHGTAIAWAPEIRNLHGIENALEIGIASATFGLVLASMVGGPIAKFLIERHKLTSDDVGAEPMVGLAYEDEDSSAINHLTLMGAVLVIHLAIIIGYWVHHFVQDLGVKLPLFVMTLLVGILLSNTVPHMLPKIRWPARTPALAVVSSFSLSLFLTMSLMSMQLWTLAGLAGPLLGILSLQTVATCLFVIFILYRVMGSNYEAAVLSAGFGGFALGATPTAIANMTAVTKKHGPAPNAFIILPLVAAFFVDLANAFVIGLFV